MSSFFDTFADSQTGTNSSSGSNVNSSTATGFGPAASVRNLRYRVPSSFPSSSVSTNINSSIPDDWVCNITIPLLGATAPSGSFSQLPSPFTYRSTVQNSICQLSYRLGSISAPTNSLTLNVDLLKSSLLPSLLFDISLTLNSTLIGYGFQLLATVTWEFSPMTFSEIFIDIIPKLGASSILVTTTKFAFTNISTTIPCLAKNSMVLMENKKYKPIQDIQRGDVVMANTETNRTYKVANVTINTSVYNHLCNIVVFDAHSLGCNIPTDKLIMSENHPIIWDEKRRPAKCFSKLPNVTKYHRDKIPKNLLPGNSDGTVSLYDLQFETLGSFVVNGVQVQSRSPRSNITPLPIELYFDQSLYCDEVGNDDIDYEFKLDFSDVEL